MSCGVGHRHGSDLELLWLWLAAVVPIGPLAWESPCAMVAALEKAKRQKKKIIINKIKSYGKIMMLGKYFIIYL